MSFPAIVLALLASTGLAGVRYGAPPPVVTLPPAPGVRTLSAAMGKPTIIHFWATWCHVCLDELPRFVQVKKHYGASVDLVTVSNEPDDVAASYLRLWNIDLPLVADTTGVAFKAYGVGPLPVTIVVDTAGNVSFAQVGEMTSEGLDKALATVLSPGQ